MISKIKLIKTKVIKAKVINMDNEYLLFPKPTYYLTQGFGKGSGSHKNKIALDVSAAKGGSYNIYAPFTGYFKNPFHEEGKAYQVYLISEKKVYCADGKYHYAVCLFAHPSEIKNIKNGQKFIQGELLMKDGNTGISSGKHLHFELSLFDDVRKIDLKSNRCNPCNYMMIKDDVKVLNDYYKPQKKHYIFKKVSEVPLPTPVPEEFKKGDKVIPLTPYNYKGVKLIQYDLYYYIMQIDKRGAVLGAYRNKKLVVWAVLKLDNITHYK